MGQSRIDRKGDARCGNRRSGAEICAVMTGVNACVGPSAADTFDLVSANLGKRLFQRFLHGPVTLLHLPAVVSTAIVGKVQNDISLFACQIHILSRVCSDHCTPCRQRPKCFMTKITAVNTQPRISAMISRVQK